MRQTVADQALGYWSWHLTCLRKKRKDVLGMREKDRRDQHLTTKLLLLCGAIGPLLFVVAFLIEGATRPDYNAWQTTISTLSWGEQGWIQIVNFSLFGVLMLCFAVGL